MNSRKKLDLSKETLRRLKSEVPSDKLLGVRGGAGTGSTCPHECIQKLTSQLIQNTFTCLPPH